MIVTVVEAKSYLRVDTDDDDNLILLQIQAAEEYIKNSTEVLFDDTNPIAKLLCLLLVQNLYDNRMLVVLLNEKMSIAAEGMFLQLKYCYSNTEEET